MRNHAREEGLDRDVEFRQVGDATPSLPLSELMGFGGSRKDLTQMVTIRRQIGLPLS